jgi:hypothetical protein
MPFYDMLLASIHSLDRPPRLMQLQASNGRIAAVTAQLFSPVNCFILSYFVKVSYSPARSTIIFQLLLFFFDKGLSLLSKQLHPASA